MTDAAVGSPSQRGRANSCVIVLFNRDLRVHDHPALAEACRTAERVIPLFVLDDGILHRDQLPVNRLGFLLDSLGDLRESLRRRGGGLFVRRGDPVLEVLNVAAETGATAVFVAADVSRFAQQRQVRLQAACEAQGLAFVTFPGVTVVPAGDLTPSGGGQHFRVFTPYWTRWREATWRSPASAPRTVSVPEALDPGVLAPLADITSRRPSPAVPHGGETAGRALARDWLRGGISGYDDGHDDLAGDRTSRLSPYLHFGCLSPLELAHLAMNQGAVDQDAVDQDATDHHAMDQGGEAFVRQLCWRDFHHQVTAAFPAMPEEDYRPGRRTWRDDHQAFEAWTAGMTGVPIVDAAMRQLLQEGWMHNRARLLVASFLTKDLGLDWRLGAGHFLDWLVDGDLANNSGNWQWVAGTGNDTRPNRTFNMLRQAHRHDPQGNYVRRYLPELAGVGGPAVHEPWRLPESRRSRLAYPPPLIEPRIRP